MQPRPSFDRTLLIPIVISIVSILGIGWIFLTGYLGKSFLPPTAVPSPQVVTATPAPSPTNTPTAEEALPTFTETSTPTETLTPTVTLTESPPTRTATPTPGRIQLLRAGKYDDTNPNIDYGLHWTALKNPGTENAYKGTLHASNAIGNEASFRFTGERLILGYQRGRNFGTVTVLIDDQPYTFHEQAFDLLWQSPALTPGDHFVRILHESGQSVNLDYIEILD